MFIYNVLMSTGYKNITARRFALLASLGETVFHARDLAHAFGITNLNTLYTTLKRYCQSGIFYRIYKGLYSFVPLEKIDPSVLGLKALHRYAYVSLETVLFDEGYISQPPQVMTLISSISKKFVLGPNHYTCRRIPSRALFNPIGLDPRFSYYRAGVSRAIADLLYFNPHAAIDTEFRVNWDEVKNIQKALLYPLTPSRYDYASQA